jgi:ABC-type antimicrobial peptide transport system permease subunit
LDAVLQASLARTSFTLFVLEAGAIVALILGLVGVYGVMSYAVMQRRRELSVRMALGATAASVRRMILGRGALTAIVGIAAGVPAALAFTSLLRSLLYGVESTDPLTFATVAAILFVAALLASYLPAARASASDPMEALREG